MAETLGREMDGISDLGHRDGLAYPFAQHLNGTLDPLVKQPGLRGPGQGKPCTARARTVSASLVAFA